ncbi:MAG TPA: SDR family NAD(P)-dependent oxidoreductase [Acidimicrobiia bacterium]|nr:SDR family NAD(P)-dependent oxidoreductase [Acidimicrobiia bacterium]
MTPATATNRFEGRVAVVTGGASGLGAAISARLADEGAQVVVADVDVDAAERVAETAVDAGGWATVVRADVTSDDDMRSLMEQAAALGPLQALVLSAAVETRAGVVECSDDDWDVVVDVNLKGPFLGMRHAVPRMVEAGGGSIVALGSTLGQITQPQYAAYCASKFGLTNLCKQVAIEHAKDGVRVNVVAPSATDTGLFMKLTAMAPDPDGLRRQVAANMPMQRLARAEEVCEAVLFLLSDASSYTSGAVLPVDGGLAARRS